MQQVSPGRGPDFVLVRPQMGENIGAAARAMLNFGLTGLRVVAPRDGWPNPRAVAMASGAGRLLDHAGPYPDTAAAVADAHLVLATTARMRGIPTPVLSPSEAMAEAQAAIAAGQRVAVLFGPERAGLETTDVALARAIVTFEVNPEFPSLNLAQCVGLMAHEWARQASTQTTPPGPTPEAATAIEIAHLRRHFEDRLEAAGFFFPPEKADHLRLNLRALLSRLPLTRGDVQLLHGILRQLTRNAPGTDAAPQPDAARSDADMDTDTGP
ncbi:MAG: RNA methyltransferase [Alkalilacustris sp.]